MLTEGRWPGSLQRMVRRMVVMGNALGRMLWRMSRLARATNPAAPTWQSAQPATADTSESRPESRAEKQTGCTHQPAPQEACAPSRKEVDSAPEQSCPQSPAQSPPARALQARASELRSQAGRLGLALETARALERLGCNLRTARRETPSPATIGRAQVTYRPVTCVVCANPPNDPSSATADPKL